MRGVVFTGKIEHTDDLDVRPPGMGEIRVRIHAAGLCHSDVSVIDGTIPFPTPVVLGHEGAGVVDGVGPGVTSVTDGDRVVLTTLGNCGRCRACETGRPTECPQTFGRLSRPFTFAGQPAYQFANTSVFTEHTVVREGQAIKLPEQVPMEVAALLGCGVLTGVGAVLNRARVQPGDRVAVFGVGGIGLNVIQAARLAGATRIVAVDTNPGKEGLARRFGATEFLDARDIDSATALKDLVPGGLDHTFECVGHPSVIRSAVDALAWGGNCVILGVPPLGTEASFNVSDMYVNKSILGCRYGASRPHHDIPMIVDLYLQGRLELDALVTRTYPLDHVERALADLQQGELARGVLTL